MIKQNIDPSYGCYDRQCEEMIAKLMEALQITDYDEFSYLVWDVQMMLDP